MAGSGAGPLGRAAGLVPAPRREEEAHVSDSYDEEMVSSQVEVAVDPDTAFMVFTDELDLWIVRGPINMHHATRPSAFRFEPGVGGRLVEVFEDGENGTREVGRITIWEPGKRVGWQSATDDVHTDVHFEPTGGGTIVRVEARIPTNGKDRGGTAWVRVVPAWDRGWCGRGDGVREGGPGTN